MEDKCQIGFPLRGAIHSDDFDSEATPSFNQCALCLRSFDDSSRHCQVRDPKITTFHHLWEYLLGENEAWKVKAELESKQVTPAIPPMCMTCYANVLILNDFHIQMMKMKRMLHAQAKVLRDIILEAGNETSERNTGRLKQFYEFVLKLGDVLNESSRASGHSKSKMKNGHVPASFGCDNGDNENDDVKPIVEIIDENGERTCLTDESSDLSDDEKINCGAMKKAIDTLAGHWTSESDTCDGEHLHVDASCEVSDSELSGADAESLESGVAKRKGARETKILVAKSKIARLNLSGFPSGDHSKRVSSRKKSNVGRIRKKLKCRFCSNNVVISALEEHYTESHNIKIDELFKCRQCPFLFPSLPALLNHKQVHKHSLGGFLCDRCPLSAQGESEKFENQVALAEHYSEVHGMGGMDCPKCGKHYSLQYGLDKHIKNGKCEKRKEVEKVRSPQRLEKLTSSDVVFTPEFNAQLKLI